MTEKEYVLIQIKTHQPIKSSNIGIPERRARLIIRELIEDGYPIASSVKPPYGYFIAQTREEVREYADGLKARGIEDIIRRRDFLRASRAILQPEQMKMVMVEK